MSLNILIGSVATVIAGLVSVRFYLIYFVWGTCKDKSDLKGKTYVITGGNSGIGKETAKQLAKRGAKVIIGCRSKDKALEAITEIKNELKNQQIPIIFKEINLASFSSVKKFADEISQEDRVDVLINNAATFGCPFELTVDGFETQFQVNHLSSALLTQLLIPKLSMTSQKMNTQTSILMVTSTLYKYGYIIEDDFIAGKAIETKKKAYHNSKLCNILYGKHLARTFSEKAIPINVCFASPGIVWTNLHRHKNFPLWKMLLLAPFAMLMVRSVQQGSQTVIYCASAASDTNGKLYRNCKETVWDAKINNENAEKAYNLTMKAIGLAK